MIKLRLINHYDLIMKHNNLFAKGALTLDLRQCTLVR